MQEVQQSVVKLLEFPRVPQLSVVVHLPDGCTGRSVTHHDRQHRLVHLLAIETEKNEEETLTDAAGNDIPAGITLELINHTVAGQELIVASRA